MDAIWSLVPIALLVFLMTKKHSLPAHKALPLAAGVLYLLKLVYFETDPNLVNATVVNGLLTAWQPILIIWGAILLFRTTENSGGMNVIRQWLNGVTASRVAQLMIIGWAFSFLIEGVSGFGTPAALAAPILVGMGFAPVRVAILCLIMNSVPVTFGAVGTPTWFGLGQIGLSEAENIRIGFHTAVVHAVAALVIPLIALSFVVTWREIRRNIVFVYLSILACVVPYLLLARFDYEFPSILGGLIGLIASVVLARLGVGLSGQDAGEREVRRITAAAVLRASFPIWASIVLLLVTRVGQLGIKTLLTSPTPAWTHALGTLGNLSVSPFLVVSLKSIFGVAGSDGAWTHKILYVPGLLPFFAVSGISFLIFGMNRRTCQLTWIETYHQVRKPIAALLGALVFVKLLMAGGDKACVILIGKSLAHVSGGSWKYIASYLGALGAFFSGSNTVSNLTFSGIQASIADTLSLNRDTILSLQNVGGAMGNMVCINNIVAVCSVLGLVGKEGFILKRTVIPMLLYGLIAAAVAAVMQ